MNINRNNYEEYFLLYADNELTDYEKAEVLMFVKNNKDLEEEFRMIHHTISRPDINIELTDKSFLFRKNASSFINEKNYEEIFVLYHDNELTEKEKLETEEFLFAHTQLKNEFDLIGMARLTPESSVIYPGKKNLYKKERTGKVVPLIFWRMMSAAVVIGFGLWFTISYLQRPADLNNTIVHSVPEKKSSPKIERTNIPEKKPVDVAVEPPKHNSQLHTTINNKKEKQQKSPGEKNNNNNIALKPNIKEEKKERKNITNNLPQRLNDETTVSNQKIETKPEEEIVALEKINPSPSELLHPKELAQNNILENEGKIQPVNYAQNASYIQDANENAENYVFYDITTDEFKKTKVGGFLKKVKRVIQRNNPIARLLSSDDKQVVSN
jgi:hypothetical protein